MNVSAPAASSLLESVLNAASTRADIGVAVLKKAQDAQEQQGDAMVKLIEQAAPPVQGLDTYA